MRIAEERGNEALLRLMIEEVPAAIAMFDRDMNYIAVSKRWLGAYLPGVSEAIGKCHYDLFPDCPERWRVDHRRGLAGQTVHVDEDSWKLPDGARLWARYEVHPWKGTDGNVGGILVLTEDITERKRAEAALRESEERFHTLADNVAQLVWMADEKGRLFWFNKRCFDYTGSTLEELEGWGWRKFPHPDHIEHVVHKLIHCFQTGEAWEDTFPIRGKDGRYRWFLSRAIPVRDEAGRVVRWFGTNTDVDEQREADRRKDEFLALLAHELRNPLAPLRTGIELLRLGQHDEKLAEQARSIMQRQVEHMVRLIDDLLDISRIARGKLELRQEVTNLGDVLKASLETSDPAVRAGRHELVAMIDVDDIQVEGDAVRLAQVFSNLINNAARYTPPGGHIALKAHCEEGQAVVVVEDDGIGIPSSMLEQVFEAFVQVRSEGRNAPGGLGLGLSLARSVVELHGGTIKAESGGHGKGSRFTVRLPSIRNKGREKSAANLAAMSGLQRHRVMVVDDNRDAVDTLAIWLRAMGQDVCVAYDGATALAEAAKFKPQFVLLDIGMPGMDGYEVAKRLQSMSLTPAPVLIALTGYGQASDRNRSAEAGFAHHAVKPVDPQKLLIDLLQVRPA